MTTCQQFAGSDGALEGGLRTYTRMYRVKDQTSIINAELELYSNTPASINGVPRKAWRLRETSPKTWDAEVTYSSVSAEETVSGRFTRDTIKTTHGLKHIKSVAATSRTAGNFNGAINVTNDGIDGIEIPVKAMSLTYSKTFSPGTLTNGFLDTLELAIQCVNDAPWKRWAKGEVLLEDAQFEITADSERLSLDIAISRNQVAAFTIPRGGTVGQPNVINITQVSGAPAKYGWDYLWLEVEEGEAAGVRVENLVAAHIEQTHDYFNFSLLGF